MPAKKETAKTTAKTTRASKAKPVKAEVVEKETEEKVSYSEKFRKIGYAYVGTIAKSIEAAEDFYKKIKEDRENLIDDLASSGEKFVTEYNEKLNEQTESLKDKFSFKKKEEAEEETAVAA